MNQNTVKHTPGPWHADSNDQVRSATGVVIARCERRERHEYMDGREQSANARLIAATPELYEALREAREYVAGAAPTWHRRTQETLEVIDAALAKAGNQG